MKKNILSICFLLVATIACAQSIPQKIKAMHQPGETYTTSFIETKVMPKLKKETTHKGNLTFKEPSNLRLDYTAPQGDYIEITATAFNVNRNGKLQKFGVKDNGSRMAMLRPMLLMAFAGNVEGIATLHDATIVSEDKNAQYTCTLTPSKKNGLSSLVLVYDKKTGKLLSLTLNETNGNYTTYSVK